MPKKSFKEYIPTMSFISQESVEAVDGADDPAPAPARRGKAPAGYKANPEYTETKSKRVQLLVQPSVYEAVKTRAQAEGISVNEAVNNALKEYVER